MVTKAGYHKHWLETFEILILTKVTENFDFTFEVNGKSNIGISWKTTHRRVMRAKFGYQENIYHL